jgi:hypothetical protein
MKAADILACPIPVGATFWLDCGRRHHRLRQEGDAIIAEHRDGRSFLVPWPRSEPIPDNEAFAARIFGIASRTRVERPTTLDPR